MSIEVKNLSFSYGSRRVLRDVSFAVHSGEYLSVLGCNGAGKSTLFRCILGLQRGYTGEIYINGRSVRRLSSREIAKQIAYIPQNCVPTFQYSVEDVVLMGTTSHLSTFSSPGKAERKTAVWAMEKAGIRGLAKRCFHHISGGERQLVMLARALAQRASVLMMDEPTASLDFGNQTMVLTQAKALTEEGYTVIQTTHNPEQSYLFSDRILALQDGKVMKQGSPKDVLTQEFVTALYGVDTRISSLYGDRVRVCTPQMILKGRER